MLRDLQQSFAAAIASPSLPPPASIAPPCGAAPVRRFNAYRNNVYAGLIGVLEGRFPAVRRLVGDEFFKAMSRMFVDAVPPRSPVLLDYGATFPQFVASFEPLSEEPYVSDVAAIEWQLHRAYHAADAPALGPSDLAGVSPSLSGGLRFTLAPATGLLGSVYPAFSIWRANKDPDAGGRVAGDLSAEDTLITRRGLDVEATRLPAGGHAFIAALAGGGTLEHAATFAAGNAAGFALDVTLALLMKQGALSGFSLPSDAHAIQTTET